MKKQALTETENVMEQPTEKVCLCWPGAAACF